MGDIDMNEIRMDMAIAYDSDEEYILCIDFFLENWLYRKDKCPICGALGDEK